MKNQETESKVIHALTKLLSSHPAPWKVEYHTPEPHWDPNSGPSVSAVRDAKGETLWTCETFTGDGDLVMLTPEATESLVAFVNATAELYHEKTQST